MPNEVLFPESEAKGLLVFLHGYGSGPDYLKSYLSPFLRAGFAVSTPKAPAHGEGQNFFTVKEPEALTRHASNVIAAWVEELSQEVPRLQAELGLPLYAAGFSMGSYVWHELISRRLLSPVAAALFGLGAVPNVAVPEGVELPIARAEAYPPTALLQLHGGADEVVPIALVEKTVSALASAYRDHPGRLALFRAEGVGHEITPAMAEVAAGWLAAWREDGG